MEKEKQSTAARILAAAEQEFLSKGYAGAKTVAIAERAGVTHAMLHYYYRTKNHLFTQVYEEKFRQMGESVLVAFADTGLPFVERIREGIGRHFDFLAANPQLPGFVLREMAADPQRMDVLRQRVGKMLGEVLRHTQREADALAARGEIARVDMADLLLDMASLNVFVFVAYPVVEQLWVEGRFTREEFLARKKRENIEVILRRIKKLPDDETTDPYYF